MRRRSDRPSAAEYIDAIFDDFMEFHGDRGVRDDNAIIGGIATLDGQPVTVIGIRKGHTTKENIRCNFGMPSPEGYKKPPLRTAENSIKNPCMFPCRAIDAHPAGKYLKPACGFRCLRRMWGGQRAGKEIPPPTT